MLLLSEKAHNLCILDRIYFITFNTAIDKLFNAIQCDIQGKLSILLVNPVILQSIFRNVSLHLPEGYELIVGTYIAKHIYIMN